MKRSSGWQNLAVQARCTTKYCLFESIIFLVLPRKTDTDKDTIYLPVVALLLRRIVTIASSEEGSSKSSSDCMIIVVCWQRQSSNDDTGTK